jgi:hypothetical protein
MATRSIIARVLSLEEGKFEGNYHHWDGHVDSLGATLFDAYNKHFDKDLDRMLTYLIDEHPAGWSTIVGANFALEPGFDNRRTYDLPPSEIRPQCYCHGDRAEDATPLETQDDYCSCSYVYAFTPDAKMYILTSWAEGKPHFGNEWKTWKIVDLNGPEPDWRAWAHEG